ncbi:hypothetical protein ACQP1K_07760 [Sphaerimonospora sp. CA-214678]
MSDLRDFDENWAEAKLGIDETIKIEIRRLDRFETTLHLSNSSGN